ncbi:ABC transporter ATP-binding protein [Deinococcus frigens]|nr:ABC transporter ATP-binding protein [Deinococcus frigens]
MIVSHYGRPVTTLAGKDAERFLKRVEGRQDHAAQLLMARATGNFKRGNE